jgi:2-aminoadipate transaminase
VPRSIPFTRGVPDASLLPVDDLRRAAVEALEVDPAGALAYAYGGYGPLREWVAARHGVDARRVLLANGSLQGVNFVAQHCLAGGGRAAVEQPTYDRSLNVLGRSGEPPHALALEEDGVDVDGLEALLRGGARPAVVYLIPTFQNPTGTTLSLEKRRAVCELADRYELLVLEDDPYSLLRYDGDPLPSLHSLDGGEHVIYSCSFTKTIAPGVRTGYLVLPERLVEAFERISANACIAPNTFAEATLAAYCRAGRFEPNVAAAVDVLRGRRDAMDAALARHFPEGSRWLRPGGGYFYWIDLPQSVDARALLPEAAAEGVAYLSGSDFCVQGGEHALRLAFSACSAQDIGEGVERLGALVARRATRSGATAAV